MQKQTVVDQIEVTRDGTVQVRMAKEIVDGENVLSREWHRTALPPGSDIDLQFAAVNEHLTGGDLNWAAVSDADISKVRDVTEAVWTAEVVAAYQA
jgi:hypothetical protein